ncbi:hypothetical protein HDU97_006809 [Phlyctochytrium planicorne]|nr:hypothetical protein HDU97_006809 [Phlyctochytrium planicorne]
MSTQPTAIFTTINNVALSNLVAIQIPGCIPDAIFQTCSIALGSVYASQACGRSDDCAGFYCDQNKCLLFGQPVALTTSGPVYAVQLKKSIVATIDGAVTTAGGTRTQTTSSPLTTSTPTSSSTVSQSQSSSPNAGGTPPLTTSGTDPGTTPSSEPSTTQSTIFNTQSDGKVDSTVVNVPKTTTLPPITSNAAQATGPSDSGDKGSNIQVLAIGLIVLTMVGIVVAFAGIILYRRRRLKRKGKEAEIETTRSRDEEDEQEGRPRRPNELTFVTNVNLANLEEETDTGDEGRQGQVTDEKRVMMDLLARFLKEGEARSGGAGDGKDGGDGEDVHGKLWRGLGNNGTPEMDGGEGHGGGREGARLPTYIEVTGGVAAADRGNAGDTRAEVSREEESLN